jgi:hypothetical protein
MELNFGQTIWDTLWELDGNTLGTRKKNKKSLSAHPLKKNKKLGLFMSALAA